MLLSPIPGHNDDKAYDGYDGYDDDDDNGLMAKGADIALVTYTRSY